VYINIPDFERLPENERWRALEDQLRQMQRSYETDIRRLEAEIISLKKNK
jgi:hypothetical protein